MSTPTPLTDEQIDALYAFVKSKYVDYYDVQLELVDHLASEVEQKMTANSAVSFETALQQVYAGFGIFGFSDLVAEKGKAVNLKNRKLLWQAFKNLFGLPNIVGSLLMLVALIVVFDFLSPSSFLIANGVLVLLTDVIVIFYFFKKSPRKGYKLAAVQYSSLLHFGATFNLYQTYFISYLLLLPNLEGSWLLFIPGMCWLGWINFAADALALEKLLKEQQKLYPLAFA